jgi:hypothetical protein
MAVWNRYCVKVREAYLATMSELFLRLCEEVQVQGLGWRARTDGDTIGFKAPGEPTFKVALHAHPRGSLVYEPPSLLVHPRIPLADLGVSNPYRELNWFWVVEFGAHGWSIPTSGEIPDVRPAIEIAVAYGRP